MALPNDPNNTSAVKSDEPPHAVPAPYAMDIWAVRNYEIYDEATFLPKLEIADQVWLKDLVAGYSHVVLYIGDGNVVQITNTESKGLAPGVTYVYKNTLTSIIRGRLVGHRKTHATPEQQVAIVKRALADVGKTLPYTLGDENCEYQVRNWIYGGEDKKEAASTQIKDYKVIAGIFGLIGLAVGGGISATLLHNVYAIVGTTLGSGVGLAIIGVGLKYYLTAHDQTPTKVD